MLRSIAFVAWALGQANPALNVVQRDAYARLVVAAAAPDIDPLTLVAIAWHESHVRSVSSADGKDVGIWQVRLAYSGECRGRAIDGAECKRERARLLRPSYNLARAVATIRGWRAYCRTKTGRAALFRRWLHGYGGYGHPRRSLICGQKKRRGRWRDVKTPKEVAKIIHYRRQLIRNAPRSVRARRPKRAR